jgi:hypothetical protein
MHKDLPKGADQQWRMKAKRFLEAARKSMKIRESLMKDMFDQLESMAPEYVQEGLDIFLDM